MKYTFSLPQKSLSASASVWRKTALITGSVGGARADPPTCKMWTKGVKTI